MQGITNDKNTATISGKIALEPTYSHELYGEHFYIFYIDVLRTSGSYDRIPVLVSERIIHPNALTVGKDAYVEGQFRSHNFIDGNKSKLKLMVFARDCQIIESAETGETTYPLNMNNVVLDGFICKPPIYRVTPFKREITDILLAVNRSYNKSDYIPCICWGRNARFCEKRQVGENVKITGRIQSRTYTKKFPDGTETEMVAYEVSISSLEILANAPAANTENEG